MNDGATIERKRRERRPLYLLRPPRPISRMSELDLEESSLQNVRRFARAEGRGLI